jgi:hypothetical protein
MKAKSWTPLPVGMTSPQWSPSDYRIAYLQNNSNGTKSLATIDTSKIKNGATTIATLHLQDVALLWQSKNNVLLYDHPSIYTFGSVWSFDLQKRNLSSIISEQRGMEAIWSNETTMTGLIFTGDASQYGGSISLVDDSGKTIEQLGFLTVPPKCLFNSYSANNEASSSITTTTGNTTSATSSYLALY